MPSAASPPAARPDRRRKRAAVEAAIRLARRSAARLPRRASRSVLLISTATPPSARIAVDAVIGLDLVGFAVARLAFLVLFLAVGCSPLWRAGAIALAAAPAPTSAEESPPPDARLALALSCSASSSTARSPHAGSANACVSISINRRPSGADGAVEICRLRRAQGLRRNARSRARDAFRRAAVAARQTRPMSRRRDRP